MTDEITNDCDSDVKVLSYAGDPIPTPPPVAGGWYWAVGLFTAAICLPLLILKCTMWFKGVREMDIWGGGAIRPISRTAAGFVPAIHAITRLSFFGGFAGIAICTVLFVKGFKANNAVALRFGLACFVATAITMYVALGLGFMLAGI